MIRTAGLRKEFRAGRATKVAVDGLTLEIPPGRVTGLLGLNGAGKTTTIKILATLLRQTGGTVRVDGLDPLKDPNAVRRRINLIAGGERMVYARMTGRENLWYFGQLYDVPRTALDARIAELLALVGLTGAADTMVERYSRGMAQRLSIARGLINDPAYLLLDEPTLGLDAPIARDLRRVVARLAAEGKGVLLTSHYLAEVEELCEHVYVIGDGRHLTSGSPAELTAQTGCHRTVRVTVSDPSPEVESAVRSFADRLGAVAGLERAEDGALVVSFSHPGDIAGPLTMAIVGAGGTLGGLEVADPSLEDAILALNDAAGLVTA
ncbi:ABC transporter ATP-binding protein [Sphaerisporangium viridialbum]|uniref:ABC transporter ATP-binding protein n=1 Tax=Sphaerisporangium viridialbum TaxID=46189 RepID=UPI003C762A58